MKEESKYLCRLSDPPHFLTQTSDNNNRHYKIHENSKEYFELYFCFISFRDLSFCSSNVQEKERSINLD